MKPTRRGIERRLDKLEQSIGQMATRWYSLSRWRAARADALTVSDAERRDIADFPGNAGEIVAHYATIRARRRLALDTIALFEGR